MKKSMRLTFRKGDWLAIGLVVALAVVIATSFRPRENTVAEVNVQIYQYGKLIRELPLQTAEEMTFSVSGAYTNTVVIRDGKAAITESDCPGTDCVHSGWISNAGRSIVCLPNRVEVRIVGTSDVDFVVR